MRMAKVWCLCGHRGSLQRPNKLHNAIFRLVSEGAAGQGRAAADGQPASPLRGLAQRFLQLRARTTSVCR